MPRIITITFSPCVDKSANVKELVPEKKMHCENLKSEPGGGGINVARVIKILGGTVTAVFPSGGHTGAHLNTLLKLEKIPFDAVLSKNETRENFAIRDEASNKQYRFGMPAGELFEDEWRKCLKIIENQKKLDYIVASGSLPPGVPASVYGQLSKIAEQFDAKLIVDTSGEALKAVANEHVYLIKPNLEELGVLLNKETVKKEEVEMAAKELIGRGKCEIVVTSLGANGALLVTKEKTYRVQPPKIEVKSTIGAGDSMVAGIVFGLSNGETLEKSLRYGVACGTAATMNFGSELCKKADVEKLLKILEP